MTVEVVDNACTADGRRAVIVMRADTITDVGSTAAKTKALTKAAAMGITRAGISDQTGHYPVNADGETMTNSNVDEDEFDHWRNDFSIAAGM
jgi:hypothetical protein